MILAAGRGERMRPLTDTCPKPLLAAGGRSLMEWHLLRLAQAGFRDVVINHAHLGWMLERALEDGRRFGLRILWSPEGEALETAGGVAHALAMLGDAPFLLVNGDIHCDFDFARAREIATNMNARALAGCCVMVPNPSHHPEGDFVLRDGLLSQASGQRLTFSGISVWRPDVFAQVPRRSPQKLRPLLDALMAQQRLGAELHQGLWTDVGTPQRLAELDARLRSSD